MSITSQEKVEVFQDELDLIFDQNIKEFTKVCIMMAPSYLFLDCPASSSGKYHPIDEIGWDGTIIHTKRVVTIAYDLCRGLNCEEDRDSIVASCIIHDLRKQGLYRSGHTVKHHPDLGAQLVQEVQKDTQYLPEEKFNIIYNSVGYHYGPWSVGKWIKPLKEFTPQEMCVYLADYVGSKKTLVVKHKNRFGD